MTSTANEGTAKPEDKVRRRRWLRRLPYGSWLAGIVGLIVAAGIAVYLVLPPGYIDDACALFEKRPEWYQPTLETERHWGLPIEVQLAILRQESSFRYDAKPPRIRILGIIPWDRATSAYGYAQAIDATWERYRRQTGNSGARREDFAAAVDFVGWYAHHSYTRLGIDKSDAFNQYLAYHEGHQGFRQQSHQEKPWLLGVAQKVQEYAERYKQQLRRCPSLPKGEPLL
jgi:hypothetical protein